MRAALAFCLLAACSADRAHVLVGSHHVNAPGMYEETNPGLMLTWEGETDITAGGFRNSYGDWVPAALASREIAAAGPVSLHPFIGVAGYRHRPMPLIGAEVRAGNVFAQAIISDGKPEPLVLTFGLTIPLETGK